MSLENVFHAATWDGMHQVSVTKSGTRFFIDHQDNKGQRTLIAENRVDCIAHVQEWMHRSYEAGTQYTIRINKLYQKGSSVG
jgi:hypothetical protein